MFEAIKNIFRRQKSYYAGKWRVGAPEWSIQDDYAYVKEAYESVVWCYACVGAIAGAVSGLKWILYDNSGRKLKEISKHPILDLLNVRVNPDFTSTDFFDLWATGLATQGKFFARYSNPIKYDPELELYPMYGHLIAPVVGSGAQTVSGFEYRQDSQQYASNVILWDRFIDPINYYDGLSPIRAAARTIDTENSAIDWNKNMFDNMAIPPGAIGLMNATQETIKEAKNRWKSDISGTKNSRMPLIFDTEKLNYVHFGFNSIDMDFILQRKLSRIEICSALGVPGQVVGDPENQTYANFEQALKAFWTQTVLNKYVAKIAKKLNSDIVKKWNPDYFVDVDISEIAALQEDENSRSERIRGMFNDNLITQNEARGLLGFEGLSDGDRFSFQLVVSDLPMDGEEDPGAEEGIPDDDTTN